MSRIKTLCTALLAVVALGAVFAASSAFATLPDMHVGTGGTYPVTSEGTVGNGTAIVGTLETEIGEKLTSTKVTAITKLNELSSLGPAEFKVTGVKEKAGNECHTATLAEGVVQLTGEYHIVYTGLATLTAGMLILFPELTVLCNKEKLKIKIKAPLLTKLNVAAGAEVSEYKIETACTKGKQEPKEYYNDEEKLTIANLLGNFGLGFEKECFQGTPLPIKSSQKIDFLF
jgi:hypothetical protein